MYLYIAKVAVWGFSPYICRSLAARCPQFCDGMPSLDPSINKEEVILVDDGENVLAWLGASVAGMGMTAGTGSRGGRCGGRCGGGEEWQSGGGLARRVSQSQGNSRFPFPFLLFSSSTCLWIPHLYQVLV